MSSVSVAAHCATTATDQADGHRPESSHDARKCGHGIVAPALQALSSFAFPAPVCTSTLAAIDLDRPRTNYSVASLDALDIGPPGRQAVTTVPLRI